MSSDAVIIVNEDSYYRDRRELKIDERADINYDHPDAFEHGLLVKHVDALRQGRSVQLPQYDYAQHIRKQDTVNVPPPQVLILEGILIFHHTQLRDRIDLKVFVDVPLDICLARRLRRDVQERGRSLDSVLTQYEQSVRPMFEQFIQPLKRSADMIISNNTDCETGLDALYERLDQLHVS